VKKIWNGSVARIGCGVREAYENSGSRVLYRTPTLPKYRTAA
jgi:hypothetical protein